MSDTIRTTEAALLGGLMTDPDQFARLPKGLDPRSFHAPHNGRLFGLLRAMWAAGETIDGATVPIRIAETGTHERYGGIGHVLRLEEQCPSPLAVPGYADLVVDAWRRRRAVDAMRALVDRADGLTGADLVDEATAAMAAMHAEGVSGQRSDANGDAQPTLDVMHAEQAAARTGASVGLSFGPELKTLTHRMNGGPRPGDTLFVYGRPGSGKTAFATALAEGIALGGRTVGINSLEMSTDALQRRRIALHSHPTLDSTKVTVGNVFNPTTLSTEQWEHLADIRAEMDDTKDRIRIDDSSGQTLAHIRAKATQWQAQAPADAPLGAIVVDYLQLMGDIRGASEQGLLNAVTTTCAGFKSIAKDLGIVCIVLVQLVRAVESRAIPDRVPRMADARGGSGIEDAADWILGVYREAYYRQLDEGTPASAIEEAMIALIKCRNGAPDRLAMQFEGAHARWSDAPKGNGY
ncbi:MAG: replicative DNA helicase [Myxococcota bacterium]|jgi:replicative DNA helicase